MPHLAVSAVGADRPGIVAAVTGALTECGCNLEDTSMTILRGHFAMMLVVDAPSGDAASVEAALGPAARDLELVVTVRAIDQQVPASPLGSPFTVTVYGADHPGIVAGVAKLLAARDVNIVDLTTRVIGAAERPVYVMLLDVTVPAANVDALGRDLDAAAGELGVECTLRANDADVL